MNEAFAAPSPTAQVGAKGSVDVAIDLPPGLPEASPTSAPTQVVPEAVSPATEAMTSFDAFLDRLTPDDLTRFEEATVDLYAVAKLPDFLKKTYTEREEFVKDYYMSQVAPMRDVYRGLSATAYGPLGSYFTQQVLGPPTHKSGVGRTIHEHGTALGTMAGAALGGRYGGVPGVFGGAQLGHLVSEYGLRQQTDLPPKTMQEMGQESTLGAIGEIIDEGVFGFLKLAAGRLFKGFRKTTLGDDFKLTPGETNTITIQSEGSHALGRTGTKKEATLTAGQIMSGRETPTTGTTVETFVRNSFGGNNFSRNQVTEGKQASEAMLARYVNSIDALNDSRTAAKTIVAAVKERTKMAAEARRDVYGSFKAMTTNVPVQDTQGLLPLTQQTTRPDMQTIFDMAAERTGNPALKTGFDSILMTRREIPLTQITPGTLQPGMQVMFQGGAPAIYQGPGAASGTSMVMMPERGRNAFMFSDTDLSLVQHVPEASYADLDFFSSTMGHIARNANERAVRDTAGNLKHIADTILEGQHLPREVREGRRLAREIYYEENETFYTPYIQGIVAKFDDSPDAFARELIKLDNSDDLLRIHKAIESMPRFSATTMTDPALRRQALRHKTHYTNGNTYWDQEIRPQLQIELIRDYLAVPGTGVSGNLETYERIVTAQAKKLDDAAFLEAHLFSIDAKGLMNRLTAMTPGTRAVVFKTDAEFYRLYNIAEALSRVSAHLSEAGSMMMVVKQSGSMTNLGGAVGGMVYGTATGKPILTALSATIGLGLPVYLGKMLTDPQFSKRLLFAVQNPGTRIGQNIFKEMAKNAVRYGTAYGTDQIDNVINGEPLDQEPLAHAR